VDGESDGKHKNYAIRRPVKHKYSAHAGSAR
jgi:hypothetical protein